MKWLNSFSFPLDSKMTGGSTEYSFWQWVEYLIIDAEYSFWQWVEYLIIDAQNLGPPRELYEVFIEDARVKWILNSVGTSKCLVDCLFMNKFMSWKLFFFLLVFVFRL